MSTQPPDISTGDLTVGRRLGLRGCTVRVASVLVNVETSDGQTLTVLPEDLEPAGGGPLATGDRAGSGDHRAPTAAADLEDLDKRIRDGLAGLRGLAERDR